MELTVYIPHPEHGLEHAIDAGSGIVGSPADLPDRRMVMIDFEGNRHGAANIVTYADKLAIAAGRHVARYPTVARMVVHETKLIAVGTWDTESGVLYVTVKAMPLLARWLGERAVAVELVRSSS